MEISDFETQAIITKNTKRNCLDVIMCRRMLNGQYQFFPLELIDTRKNTKSQCLNKEETLQFNAKTIYTDNMNADKFIYIMINLSLGILIECSFKYLRFYREIFI